MTKYNRLTLPALAFALASTALFAAGAARAEDAMKPADPMATDAMKPADAMGGDAMKTDDGMMKADDKAMADCKEKAGMETDAMKKDEAMKACDSMGGDSMGADAMKPASN